MLVKPISRPRFLIDQVTGQVVWLTLRENGQMPYVDVGLNYYKLEGTEFGVKDVWGAYTLYQLYFNGSNFVSQYYSPFNTDFKRVQLLRTKATAIDGINKAIDTQYEKYNLGNNRGLHLTEIGRGKISDPWVKFFAREYKCSESSARKLLEFKVEEWQNIEFVLESTRERAINQIISAVDINTVSDIFNLLSASMILSSKVSLKDLSFIKGPENNSK